jgi:hypothetical protein
MTFFNGIFEDMKSDLEEKTALIRTLQNENGVLKTTVTELSNRVNLVEQSMRENNVEINGIPEHKTENLISIVAQLNKITGEPIGQNDILHATRVAKLTKDSERPRTVIVKFSSPKHRDSLLAAVAKFNKTNPKEKLSTQHLGLGSVNKPVYVSEHLSPVNKALHAATRIKAKELKYKFIWIRNGRIFVRKDEFSESKLIRNRDTLQLLS